MRGLLVGFVESNPLPSFSPLLGDQHVSRCSSFRVPLGGCSDNHSPVTAPSGPVSIFDFEYPSDLRYVRRVSAAPPLLLLPLIVLDLLSALTKNPDVV